jgi:hypothetical protein
MPYRVNVRGADVVVDTLDELDSLLERFVGKRPATEHAVGKAPGGTGAAENRVDQEREED